MFNFVTTRLVRSIATAVVFCAFPAFAAPFVIAGPPESLAQTAWAWDTSRLQPFRDALTDPSNFGPGGVVNTVISPLFLSDYSNLNGVNAIIVPWWPNTDMTSTIQNQILSYFENGGNLFVFQDDASHEPIGAALGLPVAGWATNEWTTSGPFANGPFGDSSSIFTSGNYSYFDPLTISAKGGTVGGVDGNGKPTIAYWTAGQYCANCGALLLVGDVDTVVDAASFSPLNSNGRFGLNSVAWMVTNGGTYGGVPSAVPEPGSFALIGLGLAGVAAWRRVRA